MTCQASRSVQKVNTGSIRNYQVVTRVLGRLGCGAEWDIIWLPMAFCDLRCQSNFLLHGHFLLKHMKEEQREKNAFFLF